MSPGGGPRVVVRPREGSDGDALVAVLAQVHEADAYPLMGEHVTRAWLYDESFEAAWVAVAGSAVVAHVAVGRGFDDPAALAVLERPPGEVLGLSRLHVGPSGRGSGAAHALLAAAEAYAQDHALPLALEVLDHNVGAIGLYESRGWRRVGERDVDWFGAAGPRPHAYVYVGPHGSDPVAGSQV